MAHPNPDSYSETKKIFICGSALQGQPDHSGMQASTFICETKTKPIYRMHSAADGWHPAIYRVTENGVAIPGEVYEMTLVDFERLCASEPPHMYPAEVLLEDGEAAIAFFYPQDLVEKYNWLDISDYGGWAAYKAAVNQS
ncbi:gamma-glutamylcyclotransferase [Phormidium sp. CLA17]|uniref:allophanate hydrolase-related protein n=1 Tax=Leptolyngbya sp. Cla-17 TaxID=2803751 RepID=UPI0014916C74|nr:gamma-glutamylcyclotransferase [Leptolyngbya sp. Cla-17]MBM0741586.1 gamma-glutamylcyclotransferase [Leptolyngbya sp. Cla-17]